MQQEIKKLKTVCDLLIQEVNNFPKNKREAVLFDEWSLKDVLAHIIGWNLLRVKEITKLLAGASIKKINDFDALNVVFVNERKNKSWEKVYGELLESCTDLVIAFESIPLELWEVPIWEDSSMNPKKWLTIDTKHLQGEHLKQLKEFNKQ